MLLRLTLCALLLHLVFRRAFPAFDAVLAAIAAFLVTIGLLTPIAGVLASLALLWGGILHHDVWPCVLSAPIGVVLSMVGPGAFSLDAYRFGRKRVIFDDRRD